VDDNVGLAVKQLGRLILDCFDDTWMGMAGVGDANAAGEIQVAAAMNVYQISAFTPIYTMSKMRDQTGDMCFLSSSSDWDMFSSIICLAITSPKPEARRKVNRSACDCNLSHILARTLYRQYRPH